MSATPPLIKILKEKSFLANLKASTKDGSPEDVAKMNKTLKDFDEIESIIYLLPALLQNKASAGIRQHKVLTITGMDTRALMKLREWIKLQQLDIEHRSEEDPTAEAIWVTW